jgi:CRP/FNR family cyclic AMP-dependent transcriptional regulator
MGKSERFCSEMTTNEAKKDGSRLFQQRPDGEKVTISSPASRSCPLDGNGNIDYISPLVTPVCTPSYLARKARIWETALHMAKTENTGFDPVAFLASAGLGRRIVKLRAKQAFFTQCSPADAIFYLQSGRAKLTVIARNGKEATISLLTAGEFIGEESIAGVVGLRLATATAISGCTALKIEREEMLRVLHQEHAFSDLFLKFLLARSMRTQADLVDLLFNSSEKRLARVLLLMAEFDKPGEIQRHLPKITQEALAEIIGTTRSRVSFFMNRFRDLGFIEYNGQILVHKSLLSVILYD